MEVLNRVLLISNPAARSAARSREAALEAFRTAGVACEEALTEYVGHAREIALRRAPSVDAVFTLGGDGTAMEVVGALAGSGRPIGILPGGTGNLIARSLGVPLDVKRAVKLLVNGTIADVDLGRLDSGRCFAFAAGVGIDATMIETTPAALKRRLGVFAYVLSASRAVARRDRFHVRITVDGEQIEREASVVMIANFGAVLSDRLLLGPGIRQDDGMLDLCVFSPRTLRDAFGVVWRLWRGDFHTDARVLYRAGRHFHVETVPPRVAQADGELVGMTPFEVRVEPRAARLFVPQRRRGGSTRAVD